jgi:hypothetical protein
MTVLSISVDQTNTRENQQLSDQIGVSTDDSPARVLKHDSTSAHSFLGVSTRNPNRHRSSERIASAPQRVAAFRSRRAWVEVRQRNSQLQLQKAALDGAGNTAERLHDTH